MYLRLEESLEQIAGKYQVPLGVVHAAMAYSYDHREEIERSIAENEAFAEAFRRNNPSPLHRKRGW